MGKDIFRDVEITSGGWEGFHASGDLEGMRFSADPALLIIRQAWDRGCDFEEEANGYGIGAGTNGDWSGIRDSSRDSRNVMLTKALNHLFAEPIKSE